MTAAQRRNYGLSKMATKKKTASWSDLKAHLVGMEKDQLLALVKDLYGASKETQQFLHARYAVGGSDVLEPYKATITQWINPGDVRKPLSVSKAKKAITDYKKAVGDPQGLAELGVFYCEQVFASLDLCTSEDESFYDALCVMFAQPWGTSKNFARQIGHHILRACGKCASKAMRLAGASGMTLSRLGKLRGCRKWVSRAVVWVMIGYDPLLSFKSLICITDAAAMPIGQKTVVVILSTTSADPLCIFSGV